jgi:hypothetical protein
LRREDGGKAVLAEGFDPSLPAKTRRLHRRPQERRLFRKQTTKGGRMSITTAEPAEAEPPRKIILLSDGTGNSERSPFKTNVWRVYQALKLADGQQIARYDNGVGTSSLRILAVLGGAFGWGLKRNVLTLYEFLCRHYKAGDDIYGFGFSRGAFTIRVVIGLIASQGLVPYEPNGRALSRKELMRLAAEAYRDFRREQFPASWRLWRSENGPVLAWLGRGLRDIGIALRNKTFRLPSTLAV